MLRNVLLAGALVATASWGQASVSTSGPGATTPSPTARRVDELAQVRAKYAVSYRLGSERDTGSLSYDGPTPNDLGLSLWLWLPAFDRLGLVAGIQREAFSLNDGPTVVTSGGLIRANVGPTARLRLGPVRGELSAQYSMHQLPTFTSAMPVFTPVARHGLLLAARVLVDAGPVTAEARVGGVIGALAGLSTPGLTSQGLGVGGAVRVQLFRTGSLAWGAALDVQWDVDLITRVPTETAPIEASRTSAARMGVALDLQWKDPEPSAVALQRGALKIMVRSSADNAPVTATVTIAEVEGPPREPLATAEGAAVVEQLVPGAVTITVGAPGYVLATRQATVVGGQTTELDVSLTPEPPKPGGLRVSVVSIENKAAVQAELVINGQAVKTAADGTAKVETLPPGPVAVKATAPGFNVAEEAVSIVSATTSELTITLIPEKKKLPATLSGQVRNVRGGKPVVAQLEIRELKQTVSADDAGAFTVQIPGGKYTVRISAAGFFAQTKTVTVKDGDQAIFNVDLTPK